MCDFISSTTYNHKSNHASSHISHSPGGDLQAELHQPSIDPLPRVRAPDLEAMEEEVSSLTGTWAGGWQRTMPFVPHCLLGLSPTLVRILTWGFMFCEYSPLWGAAGAQMEAGFRDVQPLPASPLAFPTHSGLKILVLWSLTWARFQRKVFALPEILLPRAACGSVGRWAGSRLDYESMLFLSKIFKEEL